MDIPYNNTYNRTSLGFLGTRVPPPPPAFVLSYNKQNVRREGRYDSGEYPLFDAVSLFWKIPVTPLFQAWTKSLREKTQDNSLLYWSSGKKVDKARAKTTGAKVTGE